MAQLMAGSAVRDITPKAGVMLSGDVGSLRTTELVLDPLHARVLVLESGETKICIIALDICLITAEPTRRIRQQAAKRWGFNPDAIMVHALQSHSAPSLGDFIFSDSFTNVPDDMAWIRGGAGHEYDEFAEEQVIEAIGEAVGNMRPVDMAVASGIEGRLAFNRRAVQRDGTVFMPGPMWNEPVGNTDILYMEGPIDPEVGVLCFRADDMSLPGLIVNYACHPVHVFPKPHVSADWPGATCTALQWTFGHECTPIVLNGPCGNINPWPPYDPDYVEDHVAMGETLAETVRKVMETMRFEEAGDISWKTKTIRIPMRMPEADGLAEARKLLDEQPEPPWNEDHSRIEFSWILAAEKVDLAQQIERDPLYDYEIQVFRIGDVAILGLPGEPFSEGALAIKAQSPTRWTHVVHDVSHYVGYLPTAEACERGGHELTAGNWSRLVPEGLDIVVKESVELLNEVFAD
jgi:neutral ceramidase